MADTAHRLTDEKLEEMEKRMSAIYSITKKKIQKTADKYFSKFAKQDEAKLKLLERSGDSVGRNNDALIDRSITREQHHKSFTK